MSQIERNDTEAGRYYTVPGPDGNPLIVPSVTTILSCIGKPWLVPWAAKMTVEHIRNNLPTDKVLDAPALEELLTTAKGQHNWIKEEAGDIGSQAHGFIEAFLKGDWDGMVAEGTEPRVANCVRLFMDWWDKQRLTIIDVEITVYSHRYLYAGTLDFLAADRDGDRLRLLDWKTSKQMDDSYELQAIAYKYAYEEMTGADIQAVDIIRIGKEDADWEVRSIHPENFKYLHNVFKCARQLFEWQEFCAKRKKVRSEAAKAEKAAAKASKPSTPSTPRAKRAPQAVV